MRSFVYLKKVLQKCFVEMSAEFSKHISELPETKYVLRLPRVHSVCRIPRREVGKTEHLIVDADPRGSDGTIGKHAVQVSGTDVTKMKRGTICAN
jgi:hypothetical protein